MKHLVVLVICLLGYLVSQAQVIADVQEERPFFYDEFRVGIVHFMYGDPIRAMLNYNFILQEMQLIHPETNEILNLVRQANLTHIEIGNDIFVPVRNQGFAVIIQDGPITLLHKKHIVIRDARRGAYGIPLNTATVDRLTYLHVGTGGQGSPAPLTNRLPQNTEHRVRHQHYLMKNNVVYQATRRNFLHLYREVHPQLETFIRKNNIDFRNEQHLRSLTMFANSLLMAR